MFSTHYLTALLEPQSVAVIGASENPNSTGGVIFRNVLASGFKGVLWAINPKYSEVLGQPCLASIEKMGGTVDLAIITTAPRTIPKIVEQCGRAGIRYAILVTNLASVGATCATLERRVQDAARTFGVRLLGSNSLGIIRPQIKLNATFTAIDATVGELALVAQSGAMCASVLDWATMNKIGVSSVVALGTAMDVDFGEILDYLVFDERTRYILMHVERIRNPRHFMSALRSAARIKPIILFKSGSSVAVDREDESDRTQAAFSSSVFDAAIRRAGVVQVQSISQLFFAAKALASGFHPRGNQLAIISNGTGPGDMAADFASELGIPLAKLNAETVTTMKAFLPNDWAGHIPIDLGGDANPERYLATIRALAGDPNVHATLVVLSPLALAQPQEVAHGIVEISKIQKITICCCFMGGGQIAQARKILEDAGIPVFRTPDTVIQLFHNISKYYLHQKLLQQTPSSTKSTESTGSNNAKSLVDALLSERRQVLSTIEARALLRTFGIPVPQTMLAHNATEAMFLAEQIGFPISMKIDAPSLEYKHEEGGSRLNITTADSVRIAFNDIVDTVCKIHPNTSVNGVTIEPHITRPHARELRIGIVRDATFGPVITFGAGGHNVDFFRDRAVSLPPLDNFLARDLIDLTLVSKSLGQFRHFPPADREALEKALVGISNMVCELPCIKELEINPFTVDENGGVASDVRIVMDLNVGSGVNRYAHMAIHPYPAHLCQKWQTSDGTVITVRPARPEDAILEQEFVASMSDESRRFRFMESSQEISPSLIVRFNQVDYDREMALLATISDQGKERQIGSVRYSQAPDGGSVEFALAIDDAWQKIGLGRRLMDAIIDCARAKSYRFIIGDVLSDNEKMLRLMTGLGFSILPHPDGYSMKRVLKPLDN